MKSKRTKAGAKAPAAAAMALSQARLVELVQEHHPEVQAIYLYGSYASEGQRMDSDVDIALLLPPGPQRGFRFHDPLRNALEDLLGRSVDLVDLRRVSTVLQKEVLQADRLIFLGDRYAVDEFEMLTLSYYQKLNEERGAMVRDLVGEPLP